MLRGKNGKHEDVGAFLGDGEHCVLRALQGAQKNREIAARTRAAGVGMYIQTTGLILREVEYKESSRMLTVLTRDRGKLSVSARGAKRKGSRVAASTQLLAYSELTIFTERDRYTLTEARSVELFLGLRESVEALSLGSYFAELLDALSDQDVPDPELLSLGLNALFALSEGKKPMELVKAAFETRLACLAGFEPQLGFCAVCGRQDPENPVLSMSGGTLRCSKCGTGEPEETELSNGALDALRYIVNAPPKRFCSFGVAEATQRELVKTAERYLLTQLGRGFSSLDFYHSL